MITIQRFISDAMASLAQLYDDGEARSIVHLLLEEVLQITHTDLLFADKDKALDAEEASVLRKYVHRLTEGEPVQYILGYAYFYGLKLAVSPHTLIPRPETEELLYYIKEYLSRSSPKYKLRAIDLGTGSACIPTALGAVLGEEYFEQIDALDLSPEALEVAEQNIAQARTLSPSIRFSLHEGNLLSMPDCPHEGYDLIISNPPYIHPHEAQAMAKHVLEWEPHLALFAPSERPTIFYEAIADMATRSWLKPGGSIFLELNPIYAEATLEAMQSILETKHHVHEAQLIRDMSGKLRFAHLQIG